MAAASDLREFGNDNVWSLLLFLGLCEELQYRRAGDFSGIRWSTLETMKMRSVPGSVHMNPR
jgi:hypothetical protein